METILQLNRQELHEEIKNCIRELIGELKTTQAISLPDRILLSEACEITGLSIASIYSLTHHKKIPYKKFGSRLVFSRKALIEWLDSQTKLPISETAITEKKLIKSAMKKLQKSNY